MIDLSGVFLPVVTPFLPGTGELDLPAMKDNLRGWSKFPIRGVVVAGTTGEAVLVDEDERLLLVKAGREVLEPDILLTVGTGLESTRATIRLSRKVADEGADAVLVQPPAYYKGAMTPEALREHYLAIAEASPIPVIVYQAPLRMSTLDFPTGLVAELSKHENIVGIKDSRGKLELMGELVDRCQDGFQVLVGSGAMLYPALEVGAVGGIVAVGLMAPAESCDLFEAYQAGQSAEAGRHQRRIGPVHNDVVGAIGVGGVKAALDLLGYRGGDPRPPLLPPTKATREKVRVALVRGGLLDG
ncbi:MAG: dihydrodipicolinate synthase family protein [Gemmatimonadetes bacterium]|nr:dihydrodipicolinate synthase family protein [Gemmatimonadota bacterium]NNM05392.1 dihydrodipicolinate synthase family protein [Gemmatimonadota bacterium]